GGGEQGARRKARGRPALLGKPEARRTSGRSAAGELGRRSGGRGVDEGVSRPASGRQGRGCVRVGGAAAGGGERAGAVWDAVHLAAGELVLSVAPRGSRPDGDALHANTAVNALHYAFRASARPETRLLLTLQALAWVPMYGEVSKNK